MSITVHLACGGCNATTEGTRPLGGYFRSIVGRDWVLGCEPVEAVCPEGWVPSDPYTRRTYCPDCWAMIIAEGITS